MEARVAKRYEGGGMKMCSGCHTKTTQLYIHPLFQTPMCSNCDYAYHTGEFEVVDGNEIFCRWCGQGEGGELLLCDTCPKSFCMRCVGNNFGVGEIERIKGLSDRWCCFICSPQPFRDLCVKYGWKGLSVETSDQLAGAARFQPGIVCYDITRGREKFEIPAINTVDPDRAPPPMNFLYVNQPVMGEGARMTNNPNFLTCCSCTDDCSDPTKCECIINSGGQSYDHAGRLLVDKPAGIYECNYRCACNVRRCWNRVVSRGPAIRLEVFRCKNPEKGWGVRCKTAIPAGTFVADYLGEIMAEAEADQRGLSICDEYLYSLDCWGRSQACQRLHDLGLKRSLESRPRELFIDTFSVTKEEVRQLFSQSPEDQVFVAMLEQRGVLDRFIEKGAQVRERPLETVLAAAGEEERRDDGTHHSKKRRLSTASQGQDGVNVEDHPPVAKSKTKKAAKRNTPLLSATAAAGEVTRENIEQQRLSWYDTRLLLRQNAWNHARASIVDRCILEADDRDEHYIVDARWYGSIGRFLNHSCAPNLDKVLVFCESQDVLVPRMAFFTNDFIPANTELCYDYGYLPGNVNGRHKECLCGAEQCRKMWY